MRRLALIRKLTKVRDEALRSYGDGSERIGLRLRYSTCLGCNEVKIRGEYVNHRGNGEVGEMMLPRLEGGSRLWSYVGRSERIRRKYSTCVGSKEVERSGEHMASTGNAASVKETRSFNGGQLQASQNKMASTPISEAKKDGVQRIGLKSVKCAPSNKEIELIKGVNNIREIRGEEERESGKEGGEKYVLERIMARDVVISRPLRQFTEVPPSISIMEAVSALIDQKVSSFLVVNDSNEVLGMFTGTGLLNTLAGRLQEGDKLRKVTAEQFMIPVNEIAFCSPNDSLYHCLLIMTELKVMNLPMVAHGVVQGSITMSDILNFITYNEVGGKKNYINYISGRRGLQAGMQVTSLSKESSKISKLGVGLGVSSLPHPFKRPGGKISASQRDHRHLELAVNPTLSEDSHFALSLTWPSVHSDTLELVGLADGVGSWRKFNVDPREFSRRLMHWAQAHILSVKPEPGAEPSTESRPPSPYEILSAAYEMTIEEGIVGSSTCLIVALDHERHQLTFSNIGDAGVVVLRHVDSSVAGSMSDKKTEKHLARESNLRIFFMSQQQLRSFNLPFQLGQSNTPQGTSSFETPHDAMNTSIPLMPDDIVILGTDGLFDNMELEEILFIARDWEQQFLDSDVYSAEKDRDNINPACTILAKELCSRAREKMLDIDCDSPFALLAKENDVMWSGGMPDDCTVIVMRTFEKQSSTTTE